MEKKAVVIAGFPCVGKTTFFNELLDTGSNIVALDSDSSKFSWLLDEQGQKRLGEDDRPIRNPNFAQDYLQHIQENLGNADVIFVSTHADTQKALAEADIPYYIVYPDKSMKDEWCARIANRTNGLNNEGFVNLIRTNFEKWIESIEQETFPTLVRLPYDGSRGVDKALIEKILAGKVRKPMSQQMEQISQNAVAEPSTLSVNDWILANGSSEKAEKLEVLTFSLGEVGKLKELDGVIRRDEQGTHIVTKEAPPETGGCRYDDDHIAVVRIIDGKALMGGLYDIYALTPENAIKRLKSPVNVELTEEQRQELAPVFGSASQVTAYMTPKEVREVIVITPEMVTKTGGQAVPCHNEWDAEGINTPLVAGDVFVVSDKANGKGYRIGAEEFAGTHKLVEPTFTISAPR